MVTYRVAVLACCLLCAPASGRTQAPVSRAEAVASAVVRGARLGRARADSAVAYAQLLAARAWQNPTLAASYSKSTPSYHYSLELPFELPGQRGARIGSARAARAAAQYRYAFEHAASELDADTTYTRAIAAREKAQISKRNAQDADSLRRMAVSRRDAGDASDLDVELAIVNAGQAANVAAGDSLSYLSAVIDLQGVIGLLADRVAIVPTDSLTEPPLPADAQLPANASPLQVAAAQAALESARLATRAQRRGIFGSPSIVGGFETGDPSVPGFLPTFGLALPIPLLNRNRGPVMLAEAEQARARAELAFAEVQSRTGIARARRTVAISFAKVERDRLLVAAANRVASMSLIAYREGASSLPNVLEAQRNAREVLGQYVDDLASAWIAAAELRVLTLTSAAPTLR